MLPRAGRHRYNPGREGFGDRVTAGFVSALVMLLMIAITFAFIAFEFEPDLLAAFRAFHVWGAVLVGGALVGGFLAGPARMARFWGHAWGTEESGNYGPTIAIWSGATIFVALTCWIVL